MTTKEPKRVVLIGGGVRSGKSAFAVRRALALGERRAFVATAEAWDDEMARRIAAHREERAGLFETIEEPLELVSALGRASSHDVVVIDCLTLYVSNLLMKELDDAAIRERFDALVDALRRPSAHVILVTNEVGLGIVPENALARRFRDLAGTLHQRLARVSDELYLATMGVLLRLRPSPVEAIAPHDDDAD
ncbi:MAG: bifunctional adenosylcobinamide kinase/adenosylcobinamide-phosphate guanylyltransferase [Polyangiales bacterium]